jgi:uncharacterized membrane protein YeaQ/YmgE (transglycosylase-associated protein family)
MGFIGWVIFGGVVGWIASKIMGTDAEQGVFRNIVVGIVGALLGGFLWSFVTPEPEPFSFWDLGSWVTAIIGATLLLFLIDRIAH